VYHAAERERVPMFAYPPEPVRFNSVCLPYGMVSLLDMQKFYGAAFLELHAHLARLEGACQVVSGPEKIVDIAVQRIQYNESFVPMAGLCSLLGLKVSCAYIKRIQAEIQEAKPISIEHFRGWIETFQARVADELNLDLLFHVPSERAHFYTYAEEMEPALANCFPLAAVEMSAAGRCLAFGEGTATVFHLMRAIDMGFRCVGASLSIPYSPGTWRAIGDAIEKKMAAKYQDKTEDWKSSEPFYASVLLDIQAISRSHRNPTMHDLERKYTEAEAEYLFTVTEHFISHLSAQGMREEK
jgi:hypothetical protein